MFSQTCVKNSVHGGGGVYPSMHWAGGVYPSMHWAGGCLPSGVSAQGVSAQGVGVCPRRGCLPRGVCPGKGGVHPPPETTTTADRTHPTGMHSCRINFIAF